MNIVKLLLLQKFAKQAIPQALAAYNSWRAQPQPSAPQPQSYPPHAESTAAMYPNVPSPGAEDRGPGQRSAQQAGGYAAAPESSQQAQGGAEGYYPSIQTLGYDEKKDKGAQLGV